MRALVWALFAIVVIAISFFVIPRIVLLVTSWKSADERMNEELNAMIESSGKEKGGSNGEEADHRL